MNLFEADPPQNGERFEALLTRRNVVIERIVSAAYTDGEVYVQAQDEWVALLAGSATLEVEGEARPLRAGDATYVRAGVAHRVTECSGDAIWLAVHIHATRPPAECVVEDATPERIAAVCAAVPELSETTADTIAARVAGRRALLQIAVIDGADAGFKVGYADTPERFYSWLGGVAPDFRGRGVAVRLLQSQEAWCRAQGFATVEVKTYNRFRAMLQMLVRSGYEVFAVQGNGAIVLRKDL